MCCVCVCRCMYDCVCGMCRMCVYVYMCCVCLYAEMAHLSSLKDSSWCTAFFIQHITIIIYWINLKWQISILFDCHCKSLILKCCWLDWFVHFSLWALWRPEVLKSQERTLSWVWDCSLFGGEPAWREILSPNLFWCPPPHSPGCCLNEGLEAGILGLGKLLFTVGKQVRTPAAERTPQPLARRDSEHFLMQP